MTFAPRCCLPIGIITQTTTLKLKQNNKFCIFTLTVNSTFSGDLTLFNNLLLTWFQLPDHHILAHPLFSHNLNFIMFVQQNISPNETRVKKNPHR